MNNLPRAYIASETETNATQLECSECSIITESGSSKCESWPQANHAEMGSSATSPNISAPIISPRTTPDVDHKYSDQPTLDSNCDSMLNYNTTINSRQLQGDSTSSNMSALDNSQSTTQKSLHDEQNNSQTINPIADRPSKVNSKSGPSTTTVLPPPNRDEAVKVQEKIKEEEDKYPCLRRALSCTETPILPLGTYAVEFGFDVCSLPFKSKSKQVPALLKSQRRGPSPSGSTRTFGGESGGIRCSATESQSPKKLVSKYQVVEEQEEEEEDDESTEPQKSIASICQSDPNLRLSRDIETAPSNHTKRLTPNKQLVKATDSCADSVRMISPKRPKRDTGKTETPPLESPEEIASVRKSETKDREEEQSGDKAEEEHSPNISKTSTSFIRSDDDEQLDTDSNKVFEESYWYATKWKKDNRKWLWKCSRRTRHELLACNAMRRRYRRCDNLWLMKPSSKQT